MALGWSLGITGFLPKRNLIKESRVPRGCTARGFLPTSQDGGQQAEALGQAGSGLGRLQPSGRRLHDPGHLPGKVCQGLPISHLVPWARRDGQEQRDAPWGNTGSSHWLQGHNLGKREGAGQPLPLPQKRKRNSGCSEGLVVCRAGGWDKMAAAKSSLKRPKLLMRMKPRQHPFCTPEGTKAQASPLSHSAGATCCSLNSARYVAGMKVAFPARVLRERLPKSKDCQVKRVKPPRTVVSDWLYIISIASSVGIII